MMNKTKLYKGLLLILLVIILSSSTVIGYSYFHNLNIDQDESITLGDWWTLGIPISTTQEFYDYMTNLDSASEDSYYLTNDLDFSDFDWEYTNDLDDVIFRGILDGKSHTISNLEIYTDSTRHTYFGLFARIDGATITNLNFDNVELSLNSSALNSSNMRTGLIAGRVINGTSTISNITITDSGVRGTSFYGTGGLVGQVYSSSTILNISNIKTSNYKVFSTAAYVGGLVGYIYTSGATVNISNIDFSGEVYSAVNSSNIGGLVGRVRSGCTLDIDKAIIDLSTQNTLETDPDYYMEYTGKYQGGVLGWNQSDNVSIRNVFLTGELITKSTIYARNVGTLIGRNNGLYETFEVYYSQVKFIDSKGNISYVAYLPKGEMSELVSLASMPNISWWDSFKTNFDTESIWAQNDTGRLILQ
ncbi:MAG: hypothetical protein JEZ05_08155 [Tenericutes bacterium]|nr:hypothetical protein [Mycoplasmatota bacterium]